MDFYWNLWTEGGTSNRYSFTEINNIWYSVWSFGDPMPPAPQIAYLCCQVDGNDSPTACVEWDRGSDDDCGEAGSDYDGYPSKKTVGKLWTSDSEHGVTEGVLEDAYDAFGLSNPSKYTHFFNTGVIKGVNH